MVLREIPRSYITIHLPTYLAKLSPRDDSMECEADYAVTQAYRVKLISIQPYLVLPATAAATAGPKLDSCK